LVKLTGGGPVSLVVLPLTTTRTNVPMDKMTPLKHNVLRITLASALCALVSGCGPQTAQPDGKESGSSIPAASNDENAPPVDEANVAKVKVLGDGTILLDDKQVNIEELKSSSRDLRSGLPQPGCGQRTAAGETGW
jgi:hypothetical protein